ncbi:MAG: DUF362 domain-containing protein [Dehalococcoidales bacterium]|nr:MAG: DUF362 domain-containing protein [Dehalococcoidales bacterium]
MRKTKVSVVRCESYDEHIVLEAVQKGIDLLGGISLFVKPGEKILLKPNVLFGTDPEKGVTTHPSVFKAVGNILKDADVTVTYGDSSGFGKSESNLKRAHLKEMGDELGFDLADFDSGRQISHKDALLIKQFVIANGVCDSDGIVSLPKFKTHGLMRFTGAVKNQFGCIPGLLKSQYHVKLPDPKDFATMLVDLNTLIKPRLYIMDGIMAMEGNGPSSGKLKPMNVLLFSDDPVALDATACSIIDLDPEMVPTSIPGQQSGLGTYHSENIELLGGSIESFFDPGFEVDRLPVAPASSRRLLNIVKNRINPRPVIDKTKCNFCGTCVDMCPVEPKAVDWNKDEYHPPKYDYNLCIRCYCCQEMCPEGAIFIKTPLMARILSSI